MEFKKKVKISTDDFWYDLTDGGYITPEDVLVNENDVKKVKDALETLLLFQKEMETKKILTYR